MPISAAPPRNPRQTGFTLVELMVVLAVLALAATLVILSAPTGSSRVNAEADRLASRIAALRDLAIVEGRPLAIVVSPSGYGFERRAAAGWEALPGRGFTRHDWPASVRFQSAAARRIAFDPVGLTGTSVTLALTDGETVARISLAASGEVARGE